MKLNEDRPSHQGEGRFGCNKKIPQARNASTIARGILECFLGVPDRLLSTPGHLFFQTFNLLICTAYGLTGLLLNLTGHFLGRAFDLILVHLNSP